MKINIDEMKNEIINTNLSSSSSSSSSSSLSPNLYKSSSNYIIDNIIMICNYNSNMHLLSYNYLTNLDSQYANVLIILSMLSGIIEIINFNAHISNNIYLFVGIFNLILGMLLNKYKELKLNTNAQTHYEFHNHFEKIKIKTNMNNNIKNSKAFIYKNIDYFIKYTNNEIEILYTTRPKIPVKILNKYDINKINIELKNNNQVYYTKRKSKVFDINKSFNFCDMQKIPEKDKQEYTDFMENIRKKNIEKIKERNNNLIHFK